MRCTGASDGENEAAIARGSWHGSTHSVVRVEHWSGVAMRQMPHLVPELEEAGGLGRSACQVRGRSYLSSAKRSAMILRGTWHGVTSK